MGSPVWLGRQITQKLIGTFTITGYDAASDYQLRIPDANGPATGSGIGTGSVNAAAAALVAAWNLADAPFNRVTATNVGAPSANITLTAKNAGEPFTVVSAVAGGAGTFGSASLTVTQINKSPHDLNDAVNLSTNLVVANNDTWYLDDNDVDILYNLDATTVTPTALVVSGTWDASMGLPKLNGNGDYWEYRGRYCTFKFTTITIGAIDGGGPNLMMLNNGATAFTCNIWNTGSNPENGIPCVLLLGSSASNVLNVINGSVGVAFFGGETANLSGGINLTGNGSIICGPGCTLSGVIQTGGTIDDNSALGTVTQDGGVHVHRAGNVTALVLNGGTFEIRADTALTLTDCTVGAAGVLELSSCNVAVTITNTAVFKGGATINDPNDCLGRGGTLTYNTPDGPNSINFTRSPASRTSTIT